jgi:hypothetical protein
MEVREQNKELVDRELNIQKVQVLMSYCQTKINAMYSYLIAFVVGFVIFIGTLYYQGNLNVFRLVTPDPLLQQISSIFVFGIILLVFMWAVIPKFREINGDNDRCLRLIDDLFLKIDKGYPILALSDLKQIAFPKRNVRKQNRETSEQTRINQSKVLTSETPELKAVITNSLVRFSTIERSDLLFILIPSIIGFIAFSISIYYFWGLFLKIETVQTVDPEVINGLLAVSGIVFAFQAFFFKKPKTQIRRLVFAVIFTIEVLTLSYIGISYVGDVMNAIFPSIGTFFFVFFSLIFTLANTAFFIVYDLFVNQELTDKTVTTEC